MREIEQFWDSYRVVYNGLYDLALGRYSVINHEVIFSDFTEAQRLCAQDVNNFVSGMIWSSWLKQPASVRESFFQNCIFYGVTDAVKVLAQKDPGLLQVKYGEQKETISDFTCRVLEEFRATQLHNTPELQYKNDALQTLFDFFVKEKKVPLSTHVRQVQELANLNPKESVENKAVLVSVQQSIENLLQKYGYLVAGALPPAQSPGLPALKAWIAGVHAKEGSDPKIREALGSFQAALDAKTSVTSYDETGREALYGMYRFQVRDMDKKFTMPDIFVLVWQALQDDSEITPADREDFLKAWVFAMQEASEAHDATDNPVIGFEGTSYGCSNAMVNLSIGILASKHSCVKVNYVNATTMELKAYHDILSSWIEKEWSTNPTIKRQVEQWIKEPQNGIPEGLYTPVLQTYLRQKLKEEYQGLVSELDKEIDQVIELMPYRGSLPKRVKKLFLQDKVNEFVKKEHLTTRELQKALVDIKKPNATVKKVLPKWGDFLKALLTRLLPKQLEEQKAYKKVAPEAVKAYLSEHGGTTTTTTTTSRRVTPAAPAAGRVPKGKVVAKKTK